MVKGRFTTPPPPPGVSQHAIVHPKPVIGPDGNYMSVSSPKKVYRVGERLYRDEVRQTQRLLGFPVGVPEVEEIVNGSESAKGEGKSGSDVYSSPRLFIKSLMPADVTGLKRYMPAYVKHLAQYGKESLLPAFFMVFTLERDGRKAGKFVVMRNMLRGVPAGFRTYDLKGSWSGRYNKGKGTGKDNNFRGQRLVAKDSAAWARVRHFMGRDLRLLARLGLMDYSLLLVVADQPWQGSMAGALAGRPVHFQVHIVDVLMPFHAGKRLEAIFKATGGSSKPPAEYACRFLSFVDLHIVPASVAALELADPCDDYPPNIRKEVPRCA